MTSFPITHIGVIAVLAVALFAACSVAESKNSAKTGTAANTANSAEQKGATIPIDANGPADTVRAFYKLLREKKFREAIFLTNLRPAIEGLTDTELKDFALDFEAIAGQVPAELEINGEIITGDSATVTVNLPNAEGDANEVQAIQLKRKGDIWVIQSVTEEAEEKIRKEGKNYFYALRIDTHEQEARKMLDRIYKAQLAYSLQNGGLYADADTLVKGGLLPEDIKTSASTGYDYAIELSTDKKHYSAFATPAEYGRSGRSSFSLRVDSKGASQVKGRDNGGKPLQN